MTHIHKGKIYRLKTVYFGETTLTNEHPVLIVRKENIKNKNIITEWVETENLNVGDYVAYPILKVVKDIDHLPLKYEKKEKDTGGKDLPENIKVDNNFLRLAGYYIAEGNVHNREVNLTFGSSEMDLAEDAKYLFNMVFGLNATIKERENKRSIEVHVSSSYLTQVFSDWFGDGASNKRILHDLLLLPIEKQKDLLIGLWRGDGFVNNETKKAGYKTISLILKEQIKMLLLRYGIIPYVYENKAYDNHKKSYSIEVKNIHYNALTDVLGEKIDSANSEENHHALYFMDNDYIYLKIRSLNYFDYNGPVYNFKVEEVNSYVSNSATLHNCGDFGVLTGITKALGNMKLDPEKVVAISGIGCSGKTPHYLNIAGAHTLHGRSIPYAVGVKLANPNLKVLVMGGDGDMLGIGAGHFVAEGRRNSGVVVILYNNSVYGLTKGQAAPTMPLGEKVKSIPRPNILSKINPIPLAMTSGYSFVARGFSSEINHLSELIQRAINHEGSSLIEVLQPCPTYNDVNTLDWYRQRVYKLEEDKSWNPVVNNKEEEEEKFDRGYQMSLKWGDHIPIGIMYENNTVPSFTKRLSGIVKDYLKYPPSEQDVSDSEGYSILDPFETFNEMKID